MRKSLRICWCVVFAAILFLLALLLWFLVDGASRAHSLAAQALSGPLAAAQSVTITERVPYEVLVGDISERRDLILKSVSLSSSQIAEFSHAIRGHLDYGRPKIPQCYQPPYHRIEIVHADGAVLRFDVSFACRIFTFEDRRHPLPILLSSRLTHFFASLGIPPRSDEAYAELSHKASGR